MTPDDIMEIVAQEFGFPVESIKGKSRRRELVWARFIIAKIFNDLFPELTLKKKGRIIGNDPKDHATILYYNRQHAERISTRDEAYIKMYHRCTAAIDRAFKQELYKAQTATTEEYGVPVFV